MKTFKEWLIKENLDGYGQASTNYDDYSDYDDDESPWSNHDDSSWRKNTFQDSSESDSTTKTNASDYVDGLRIGEKTPVTYRGKSILLTKYANDAFMLGNNRMYTIDRTDMLNNGSLKVNWDQVKSFLPPDTIGQTWT